jgi:hypothetical protein
MDFVFPHSSDDEWKLQNDFEERLFELNQRTEKYVGRTKKQHCFSGFHLQKMIDRKLENEEAVLGLDNIEFDTNWTYHSVHLIVQLHFEFNTT